MQYLDARLGRGNGNGGSLLYSADHMDGGYARSFALRGPPGLPAPQAQHPAHASPTRPGQQDATQFLYTEVDQAVRSRPIRRPAALESDRQDPDAGLRLSPRRLLFSDLFHAESAAPHPAHTLPATDPRVEQWVQAGLDAANRRRADADAAELEAPPTASTGIAPSSLVVLLAMRPNVPSTSGFAVLKLKNIPWDLGISDVCRFFASSEVAIGHSPPHLTQAVHIIMNRETGKTQSECFVEFPKAEDAERALVRTSGRGYLRGRVVVVAWSSQEELRAALFPTWAGSSPTSDVGNTPSSPAEPGEITGSWRKTDADAGRYGSSSAEHAADAGGSADRGQRIKPFLSRDEINSILMICKQFKLYFSRKCAERPFENIISIITKMPWHEPELISTIQRDHIFEMLKLSLESLHYHLSREHHQISESLQSRMIRAGLCVPLFTERQKTLLLSVARMACPADLMQYVYNPPDPSDEASEIDLAVRQPSSSAGDGSAERRIAAFQQQQYQQQQGLRAEQPHNSSPYETGAASDDTRAMHLSRLMGDIAIGDKSSPSSRMVQMVVYPSPTNTEGSGSTASPTDPCARTHNPSARGPWTPTPIRASAPSRQPHAPQTPSPLSPPSPPDLAVAARVRTLELALKHSEAQQAAARAEVASLAARNRYLDRACLELREHVVELENRLCRARDREEDAFGRVAAARSADAAMRRSLAADSVAQIWRQS
ncbi:hypothetical protein BDK51DRAFT_31545 [Blyttiomyces helicus]|uniref:RRM domain-containing protein n=1 Tax=Blyttiomyces helicus TaxID=388810 RepID=A0A4P9W811_9FUNG|nr:hypothetical protein BDK51DRAFT_31545 [Blyttiomyces helicus]|eukprot:RKO86920.1 hypothetical protein BDK51DRAFT_31545 [Blyttiomyces helicus]